MRKTVSIVLSVVLLALAVFIAATLIKNKTKPKPVVDKIVKTVFVDEVKNSDVPIVITTSGNLSAKHKIELYSEVQGVLQPTQKEFKAGTHYAKGATMLNINRDEFYANLLSQKSNFFNSLTAIMPDIRLDYPDQFQKWQNYLNRFDINKTTPKLPDFASDKEKYFISGRGITTAYYNVKNLEVKLDKYTLNAPYSGVLTEALVTPGTLVRVGQKLGEFIDPSVYELEVSVNAEFANLLKTGNAVRLHNLDRTKEYKGHVVRINGKVDATSQTIKAFIEVSNPELKEGMYLEADLDAKSEANAYEVSRKLLVDNSQLYVVNDTVLNLVPVKPVYFSSETAVVKGLEDGTLIMSKPTPGAYDGMQVKIFKANN